jgi:DNA-directed RNA polymerase II subunit RPB1
MEENIKLSPKVLEQVKIGPENSKKPQLQIKRRKKQKRQRGEGAIDVQDTDTMNIEVETKCGKITNFDNTSDAISKTDAMLKNKAPNYFRKNVVDLLSFRSELPFKEIKSIEFTLVDNDKLIETGIEITNPKSYGDGSINDPRMGVTDPYGVCSTCRQQSSRCIGHYGYIPLTIPVFHPNYYKIIDYILKSVCNDCIGILLTDDEIMESMKYSGVDRLKFISNKSSGRMCTRSSSVSEVILEDEDIKMGDIIDCKKNRYFSFDNIDSNILEYTNDAGEKVQVSSQEILEILKKIDTNKEVKRILGFSEDVNVSDYMIRAIAVVPPCDRNASPSESGIDSDRLGGFFTDIFKVNMALRERKNNRNTTYRSKKSVLDLERDLVRSIKMLFGTDGTMQKIYNKNLASIHEQLKKKKGLIRGNLAAKRTGSYGRTVAGPGIDIRTWEIGIPYEISRTLTKSIKVSSFNIESLQEMLVQGLIKSVRRGNSYHSDNYRISINDKNINNFVLRIGDSCDVMLENGDVIVANRQPSLHASSIMGHEVRIHPEMTIKMPLENVQPYNADFDGDEFNIHSFQTNEARSEARTIKNVINCLINPSTSATQIGLNMDTLSGIYRLTKDNPRVNAEIFYDIIMKFSETFDLDDFVNRLNKNNISFFDEDGITTGRILVSTIFPRDLYYDKKGVLIKDGILISGALSKAHIGTSSGTIQQYIAKNYDDHRLSIKLIDNASKLVNLWSRENPMTVGLRDCYLDDDAYIELRKKEIEKAKILSQQLGLPVGDDIDRDQREQDIIASVNRAEAVGTKILTNELTLDNALKIMADSGSKGNKVNVAQIVMMISQQFMRGLRSGAFGAVISEGSRSMPYFSDEDMSPETQGAILSSYILGVNLSEYLFMQWGGREGLLDTALKTSETGDRNRKNFKFLEDIVVSYDGTVRNNQGDIIQLAYRYDGFDPRRLINVPIEGPGTEPVNWFIDLKHTINQYNLSFGYDPQEYQ